MVRIEEVRFSSGSADCAGSLYLPAAAAGPFAAIAMAPGLGAVRQMGLQPFAQRIAQSGVAVLLFDYRCFGGSGGVPREHLVPAEQVEDYRNALTWLSLRPGIDGGRLGLWGSSFSAGHVLQAAASDRRVKAVVAQTPALDMPLAARRRLSTDALAARSRRLAQERMRLYREREHRYLDLASPDGERALMGAETFEWQERMVRRHAAPFANRITLDSLERIFEYAPALAIDRIAPTPLLMLLAANDSIVPGDLARDAFARAGEPKQLMAFEGGHYDVYDGAGLEFAAQAAVEWFGRHLGGAA